MSLVPKPLFDVGSFGPANTLDTERACAARIHGFPTDCEEAQNRLAMGAMGEAVLYVHKVCRGRIPPSEIISLSYEALLYAARQVDPTRNRHTVFDPRKGRFFAYSKPYLRSAVHTWWGQQDVVKGSNTRMETLYQEVAPASLLEIIFDEEHPAQDQLQLDRARTDQATSPELDRVTLYEIRDAVAQVADKVLTASEREFVSLYYSFGMPLSKLGEQMGKISREGARLRLSRILDKLRIALRKQGFQLGKEKYLD